MQDVAVSGECLRLNALVDTIRHAQLQEEHAEDAMVRHLLELSLTLFLILQQDASYYAEHLVEEVDFGEGIVFDARVFDKERDEADEAINSLVGACARVEGVGHHSQASLNTHFGGEAEEARNQLISLQHACRVHLKQAVHT